MYEAFGVIYVVTNEVNGKQYVGQTVADPQWYWKSHLSNARSGDRKYLYNAIRKYGEQCFQFNIVFVAFDKLGLDLAEDHFIVEYNTLAPHGYNLKGGGSTGSGKFSDEMRRVLSAAIKAACEDPEVRQHKSAAMAEVWQRPEHRQKIAEVSAKSEVRERRSASRREVLNRPEYRVLVRQNAIEQFSALGVREAVAERTRQQFADPEKVARHRAAYDNPETKAKLRAQNVGKRWITNGVDTRNLWPGEEMPEGWRYGASWKPVGASGKRWINDGIETKMIPADDPVPDGWKLGKLDLKPNARNAGMRWITDRSNNRMIACDAEIPAGWFLGMTRG